MMLTAAMIATATGGSLASGDPHRVIDGFSIDSRTLRSGDLFFAIVAARDGHEFVRAALQKGACGAVIQSMDALDLGPTEAAPFYRPVIVRVADTTAALQDLGRFVRRQVAPTVVAITGSAGKTTTKEMVAQFVSGNYRVIRNKGNLNNHLGLPLSLLEVRHGADVAVMELGMNHAGEIRVLVGIAEPEVRVWTNVGDAHLGYFRSREALADAKAEILENGRPGDVLVCNADDPLVMDRIAGFAGRTIRFGLSPDADVVADSVQDLGLDGSRLTLRTRHATVEVSLPLVGRGNVSNLLAAASVAMHLGVPLGEVAARCAHLAAAPHRGAVVRLPKGVAVLDDSYNSSPTALKRVLDVLSRETRARRKAAVLGEMLELGDHARRLHEECGKAAAAAGLDRLIVVGGDAAHRLADAAIEAGMPPGHVSWTPSSDAAADLALAWLAEGDLVLVKGSRGIRTETIVDRITKEFS
jgi:UDP-N-acetylmuramoyl-tripeptide--D-alanyl-D-alanine ligase